MKRLLVLCFIITGCGKNVFDQKISEVVSQARTNMNLLAIGTTKGEFDDQLKKLRLSIAQITATTPDETSRCDTAKALLSTLEEYATKLKMHTEQERSFRQHPLPENKTYLVKQWRDEANKEEAKLLNEANDLLTKLDAK